ncbi:MT-A70-domain-containing protein [Cunninghamella echinulata]|nr:MT-A70-domain-containing protein [Cunninghamella echinulata]
MPPKRKATTKRANPRTSISKTTSPRTPSSLRNAILPDTAGDNGIDSDSNNDKGKGKVIPPIKDINNVSDDQLKVLLLKEKEITQKIDTLIKEMDKMDDLRTVGDENPHIIPEPRKKQVNSIMNYMYRKHTEEDEEEEEEEEEEPIEVSDDEEEKEKKKKADQKKQQELAEAEINYKDYEAPDWCIPIKANVMTFDWDALAKEVQFDVIVADPPWQLATSAPTRGVAIAYQQLPDVCIEELPIPKLQKNGFIFIWVINNKYARAFEMMERWGYTYVDDITWVKQTVNRRMAKGHGYYLQHAKETCLVGKKGDDPPGCRRSIGTDVIFSERRGQSQKPEELYELIEELVPNGKYLEIFGRKNNLRDYWITVGNEL